jgi:hypothetical protein
LSFRQSPYVLCGLPSALARHRLPMTEPTKSPIKDKPLRHAGQSLEEERRLLIEDKIETPMLMALVFVVLALLEWWRYWQDIKLNPVLFTIAATVFVLWSAWRVWLVRTKLRALIQGIEGERAVGQFLERLRGAGYEVFHDVVATGFNIDHVLIGPAGVFSVETKTWSKPVRGDARVQFDGERLLVNGLAPDRDPVIQAKAQATWLRQQLAESTGKSVDVHPVVLFPGWFIDSPKGDHGIWVLEPKALPSFLSHSPRRLEPADVKLASFHLSRFIRSVERSRD